MEVSNAKRPPMLAVWLLAFTAPPEYRDFVAGDLHEEYVRCNRGYWWYWRQVLRSCPWFVTCERLYAPVILLVTAGWLFAGSHALWSFVLSKVPLKADPAVWVIFR